MLDSRVLPLRGSRAVLRVMRPDDASAYASGTTDPAVRRYAHLPEPEYTEASVTALVHGTIRDGLKRGDLAVLTVADPATDAFAGSLVLFGTQQDSAEVGFWVHPDHRGEGVARAALGLGIEFAGRSGLVRLTARTAPENRASQRVLEQAGFIKGETTRDLAPSGQEVALVHYLCDIAP
ncbi:GNAT family protein [Streptomyces sp. NPDC029526]|uniref:GNAT family N-acetyltransferase n=1 Tax=Streptomyces sp. NPDC029526 TaxID=3155728 RepID=UPI003401130E